MKTYDLTIILPGLDPEKWVETYKRAEVSIGNYTFEIIGVGPNIPKNEFFDSKLNFKFIRDFGSPSRCLQLGAQHGNGKYVCFFPDDGVLDPSSLKQCLDFMQTVPREDGMVLMYSEGPGFSGVQHLDPSYWVAYTHPSLRKPSVKSDWLIAPVFLFNREFYIEVGGIDCRFEHMNMNLHDLVFRTQKQGFKMHRSPCRVFSADWIQPNPNALSLPLQAYYENDLPLFDNIYNNETVDRYKIDYNNWQEAPNFWERKYKNVT